MGKNQICVLAKLSKRKCQQSLLLLDKIGKLTIKIDVNSSNSFSRSSNLHKKDKLKMGVGLSRVSGNCLPCPRSIEDKNTLEQAGVVFHWSFPENSDSSGDVNSNVFDESMLKRNTMIEVTLPDKYGILKKFDRGDVLNAYLIDDRGYVVAEISWVSKGGYENQCSITPAESNDRHLDMSQVSLDSDGFYKVNTSVQKQYHDLVNKYYKNQYRGAHQDELNDMYNQIKDFETEHVEVIKINYQRLEAQGINDNVSAAITTVTSNFAIPFPFTDPSPWIKNLPSEEGETK